MTQIGIKTEIKDVELGGWGEGRVDLGRVRSVCEYDKSTLRETLKK